MIDNIKNFLHRAFPFLMAIALWRLASPFWNPGGMLALIPIWFCVFVYPVSWFGIFGAIMCFLIDYKFNTVFLWLALYCLFYALNGFQTIIDLKRMDHNAVGAFMIFAGAGIVISVLSCVTFSNILRGAWISGLLFILYMPLTLLIQRVRHD